MAAPLFYNQGDQAIYDSGQFFIPQEQYRLSYNAPTIEEEQESIGIPNTNSFRNFSNSDNRYFSGSGNAFGYGSPIEPGGYYGAYNSINYTGGLPGNVKQYGVGRQFEDPSASPIGETYSYKKTIPSFMRVGAAFVPGGNFLLNLAEKRMNANRDQPSGTYRIGGLDESMKGYYDNLAGSGMLFDGPSGIKTLTGKNFAGKGYLEGQIDLAKGFGFDTMTDEEIADEIARTKANPKKQFQYKQMLESSQMYKTSKAQEENIKKMKELAAAKAKSINSPDNYGVQGLQRSGNYGGSDTYSGQGSTVDSAGNVTGSQGQDLGNINDEFARGGRVNFKRGGLASIL